MRYSLITRLSAVCLMLLLSGMAFAFQGKPLAGFTREEWSTKNGLPHNQVNAIAQTPEGYLWFATWEGLVQFNGQEFRIFGTRNIPEILANGIRSVSVGASGNLVVGTSRGGVSIYDDGVWRVITMENGLPQNEISGALEDKQGRLWVATESAGVSRIQGRSITHFNAKNGLSANRTYGIFEDGSGAIWVATAIGLTRIQDDQVQVFGEKNGLPQGGTFAVAQGNDGMIYVATEEGVYKGKTGVFSRLTSSFPNEAIASLAVDAKDHLWIGTVNRGLMRFSPSGLETFGRVDGLPNSRVASLYVDREGNTWAGTNAGLMRFSDTPFTTLDSTNGLSDDYTRTVLEAPNGTIWIGTSQGLTEYRDGVLRDVPLIKQEAVLGLAHSQDGSLWVGMYSTGLMRLKDGQVKEHLTLKDGIPGNQIRAILEARDGTLWAGGALGLLQIKDGKKRIFTTKDGLSRDYVLSLAQDKQGAIWIGTSNGLAVYSDGKLTPIDISRVDNAQNVFSIMQEEDGTMWFASDRGLLRYKAGKFVAINMRHGLPVDTFFQVVADNYGNYWLTSNAGVLYLKKGEVNAVADGKAKTLAFQLFTEPDGLASRQCNGGAGPAAIRSSAGSIWVATAKGISIVQPDELPKYQLAPPPVVIEGLRVNDKLATRDAKGRVILPADTRKLELDYVSLSYRTPEQIRYRYRLQGFDNDWTERSQLRNAQYTNLPPGKYVFEVGAANRGSGWGPETAELSFEIQPRLYQRPWFLPLMVLLTGALLFGLYRARVSVLEIRERELSGLVDQRTSDLSRKNLELESLNHTIREQSEAFERQARTDALTGLVNRRYIETLLSDAFRQSVKQAAPMSVALLDIDHFKQINDRFSHGVGDDVLRRVSRVLLAELDGEFLGWRGEDCLARWGGEEFVIMLPGQDAVQARALLERMRLALEHTDWSDLATGLQVTASIGAVERSGFQNHERMLAAADERLYEAKHQGRNRVIG